MGDMGIARGGSNGLNDWRWSALASSYQRQAARSADVALNEVRQSSGYGRHAQVEGVALLACKLKSW
jgi:hypothetical protein